jgi:hypothetical protein
MPLAGLTVYPGLGYDEHLLINSEQQLIWRNLTVKYLVLFIAVVPLLMSGVALHGQEPRGDAAGRDDAQLRVPMLAVPRANAVDPVEAPELTHCLNGTKCLPDPLSCGLDFAGKARYFAEHSFGVGAFVGPLLWSAPILAKPPAHYPKDWRQGAGALGRLYGDALVFQTAAQSGRFVTGVVFHEDPRYSASSSRNPFARAMHAIAFTASDRSDSGRTTFALSNFVASASAGFVGNAYLPRGYNDTSHGINRMGIEFGSLAVTNLAQEFTPEFRWLGKRMHLPGFMLPNAANR